MTRQFVFLLKQDDKYQSARCTAPKSEWAWLQLVAAYGAEFNVYPIHLRTHEPHEFLGEIDAADMTEADALHLLAKVAPYIERMLTKAPSGIDL